MLLEVVFNHLALFEGKSEPSMQYFIDNLNDPAKMAAQGQCRVEVDMMGFLSSRGETKQLSLVYFRDYLSLCQSPALPIFQYPPFFLHLTSTLRSPLEPIANKQIVLDLLNLRLDSQGSWRVLMGSSANLLQEAIRLMV